MPESRSFVGYTDEKASKWTQKAANEKPAHLHGLVIAEAEKLNGTHIYLDKVSVGATINIMMAASMAEGNTIIENAAKEPHVVDVANFLNSMGANIRGAGTDVIRIVGVEKLHKTEYSVIPDQIEAGTFMFAAAEAGGDVLVKDVIPKHLEATTAKLVEAGCKVEEFDDAGAGDQGMMFGYASDETEEYMPYPIALAHKLARRLTEVRKNGTLPYLRPDGKTQVTVEYDENGVPAPRLDAVVLSTQHDPDVSQEQIHEDVKKDIFDEIIPADMVDENTKYFINPTGRFVIGGPHGDSGLTGRKIILDTYGEWRVTAVELSQEKTVQR